MVVTVIKRLVRQNIKEQPKHAALLEIIMGLFRNEQQIPIKEKNSSAFYFVIKRSVIPKILPYSNFYHISNGKDAIWHKRRRKPKEVKKKVKIHLQLLVEMLKGYEKETVLLIGVVLQRQKEAKRQHPSNESVPESF